MYAMTFESGGEDKVDPMRSSMAYTAIVGSRYRKQAGYKGQDIIGSGDRQAAVVAVEVLLGGLADFEGGFVCGASASASFGASRVSKGSSSSTTASSALVFPFRLRVIFFIYFGF